MAVSTFAKVAIAAAGLTLASLGSIAPASAQGYGWGGPRVDTVQYVERRGDGWRGEGWRREGWRRGPRCFTERVVRRTPYGRRVIERRVCR
jgi:hypothetical protein